VDARAGSAVVSTGTTLNLGVVCAPRWEKTRPLRKRNFCNEAPCDSYSRVAMLGVFLPIRRPSFSERVMRYRILRRFVILMIPLTIGAFFFWGFLADFVHRAPGDYHTEVGDIRLRSGEYEAAMKEFNKALEEQPNHRGALMGRALAYIQTNRPKEGLAELSHLITYLTKSLKPEDLTGLGTLAAAYANRGILNDKAGRYQTALEDYVQALKTDEGAVDGPNLLHRILYGNTRGSTVRDRAIYIHKQLQLAPDKRLMRVPEIDAMQRMYKP
jgi:tetratricopeptide (TPR) repeat protein